MYRTEVVQELIYSGSGQTYLEVGVSAGGSFIPVIARRKIGVDPSFYDLKCIKKLASNNASEVLMFEVSSSNFFNNQAGLFENKPIDVAFVDGLHTYKQSLEDIENCLKYISKKGVIVVHDCNPYSPMMAEPANSYEEILQSGWSGGWCGDVWKTILHLRSTRKDLQVLVLDSDYGLGLIRSGAPEDTLPFAQEEIRLMSYKDLDENRKSFLNLKRSDYFSQFIDNL